MSFTEQQVCTGRMNCFHCRNNEQFRSQMETQFGKWECPIGLSIGAPIEHMPQETKDQLNRQEKAKEEQQKRINELEHAVNSLDLMVDDEGRVHINTIRNYVLPNTKTAMKCISGGEKIGSVEQECCGGKINQVDAFSCKLHVVTTDRKCVGCNDFNVEK